MSPTTTSESAEDILFKIAVMCLEALDPCLTRETLAQRMKDIYILADRSDDDDSDSGKDNTEPQSAVQQ
jgi:hypothetical protein